MNNPERIRLLGEIAKDIVINEYPEYNDDNIIHQINRYNEILKIPDDKKTAEIMDEMRKLHYFFYRTEFNPENITQTTRVFTNLYDTYISKFEEIRRLVEETNNITPDIITSLVDLLTIYYSSEQNKDAVFATYINEVFLPAISKYKEFNVEPVKLTIKGFTRDIKSDMQVDETNNNERRRGVLRPKMPSAWETKAEPTEGEREGEGHRAEKPITRDVAQLVPIMKKGVEEASAGIRADVAALIRKGITTDNAIVTQANDAIALKSAKRLIDRQAQITTTITPKTLSKTKETIAQEGIAFLQKYSLFDESILNILYLQICNYFLAGHIQITKELHNDIITNLNALLAIYFRDKQQIGENNTLQLSSESFDIDIITRNKGKLLTFIKHLKIAVNDWVITSLINNDFGQFKTMITTLTKLLVMGFGFYIENYDSIISHDDMLLFYFENIDIRFIQWGMDEVNMSTTVLFIRKILQQVIDKLLDVYNHDDEPLKPTYQMVIKRVFSIFKGLYEQLPLEQRNAVDATRNLKNTPMYMTVINYFKGGFQYKEGIPEIINLEFIDYVYRLYILPNNFTTDDKYKKLMEKRKEFFDKYLQSIVAFLNQQQDNVEDLKQILRAMLYDGDDTEHFSDEDVETLYSDLKDLKNATNQDISKKIQKIFYEDKIRDLTFLHPHTPQTTLTFDELIKELFNDRSGGKRNRYKDIYDNQVRINYKLTSNSTIEGILLKDLLKLKTLCTSTYIYCNDIQFYEDLFKVSDSKLYDSLTDNREDIYVFGDMLIDKNDKQFPYVFNLVSYKLPILSYFDSSDKYLFGPTPDNTVLSIIKASIMNIKMIITILNDTADADNILLGIAEYTDIIKDDINTLLSYIQQYLKLDNTRCNFFKSLFASVENVNIHIMQYLMSLDDKNIADIDRCFILNILYKLKLERNEFHAAIVPATTSGTSYLYSYKVKGDNVDLLLKDMKLVYKNIRNRLYIVKNAYKNKTFEIGGQSYNSGEACISAYYDGTFAITDIIIADNNRLLFKDIIDEIEIIAYTFNGNSYERNELFKQYLSGRIDVNAMISCKYKQDNVDEEYTIELKYLLLDSDCLFYPSIDDVSIDATQLSRAEFEENLKTYNPSTTGEFITKYKHIGLNSQIAIKFHNSKVSEFKYVYEKRVYTKLKSDRGTKYPSRDVMLFKDEIEALPKTTNNDEYIRCIFPIGRLNDIWFNMSTLLYEDSNDTSKQLLDDSIFKFKPFENKKSGGKEMRIEGGSNDYINDIELIEIYKLYYNCLVYVKEHEYIKEFNNLYKLYFICNIYGYYNKDQEDKYELINTLREIIRVGKYTGDIVIIIKNTIAKMAEHVYNIYIDYLKVFNDTDCIIKNLYMKDVDLNIYLNFNFIYPVYKNVQKRFIYIKARSASGTIVKVHKTYETIAKEIDDMIVNNELFMYDDKTVSATVEITRDKCYKEDILTLVKFIYDITEKEALNNEIVIYNMVEFNHLLLIELISNVNEFIKIRMNGRTYNIKNISAHPYKLNFKDGYRKIRIELKEHQRKLYEYLLKEEGMKELLKIMATEYYYLNLQIEREIKYRYYLNYEIINILSRVVGASSKADIVLPLMSNINYDDDYKAIEISKWNGYSMLNINKSKFLFLLNYILILIGASYYKTNIKIFMTLFNLYFGLINSSKDYIQIINYGGGDAILLKYKAFLNTFNIFTYVEYVLYEMKKQVLGSTGIIEDFIRQLINYNDDIFVNILKRSRKVNIDIPYVTRLMQNKIDIKKPANIEQILYKSGQLIYEIVIKPHIYEKDMKYKRDIIKLFYIYYIPILSYLSKRIYVKDLENDVMDIRALEIYMTIVGDDKKGGAEYGDEISSNMQNERFNVIQPMQQAKDRLMGKIMVDAEVNELDRGKTADSNAKEDELSTTKRVDLGHVLIELKGFYSFIMSFENLKLDMLLDELYERLAPLLLIEYRKKNDIEGEMRKIREQLERRGLYGEESAFNSTNSAEFIRMLQDNKIPRLGSGHYLVNDIFIRDNIELLKKYLGVSSIYIDDDNNLPQLITDYDNSTLFPHAENLKSSTTRLYDLQTKIGTNLQKVQNEITTLQSCLGITQRDGIGNKGELSRGERYCELDRIKVYNSVKDSFDNIKRNIQRLVDKYTLDSGNKVLDAFLNGLHPKDTDKRTLFNIVDGYLDVYGDTINKYLAIIKSINTSYTQLDKTINDMIKNSGAKKYNQGDMMRAMRGNQVYDYDYNFFGGGKEFGKDVLHKMVKRGDIKNDNIMKLFNADIKIKDKDNNDVNVENVFDTLKVDIDKVKKNYKRLKATAAVGDTPETNMILDKFVDNNGDTLFERMLHKYNRDVRDKIPEIAKSEFYEGVVSNDLDPEIQLAIDFNDKLVFSFVIVIMRIIALWIIGKFIDGDRIRSIKDAIYYYSIVYVCIFLLIILVINIDLFRLRMLINYCNMHVNTSGIAIHIVISLIIGYIIYYLILNTSLDNENLKITKLSKNQKIKLRYKLEILTIIILIFLVVISLII